MATHRPFILLYGEEGEVEEGAHTRSKRYVQISGDITSQVDNFYNHPNDINIPVLEQQRDKKERRKAHETHHRKRNPSRDQGEDLDLFEDYEHDDLTEAEISSHRLKTSGDTLAFPKWWGRKKGRRGGRSRLRKKRKKKTRRTKWHENETTKTEKAKWNSLPKIWKSFGKEVKLVCKVK